MDTKIHKKIFEKLEKIKKFPGLFKIPEELFKSDCLKVFPNFKLKILIINAPCNGFGDLVFLKKLANFLDKTYNVALTLATTNPERFAILQKQNSTFKMAKLSSLNQSSKTVSQCRSLANLRVYDPDSNTLIPTKDFDLFFIAPLSFDFDPKIEHIRRNLAPTATKFNTFFFSEYNDYDTKDFDFHTGVGKKRLGILIEDNPIPNIDKTAVEKLVKRDKYGDFALIYIADIHGMEKCLRSFVELVSAKYSKENHRFQIVCPEIAFVELQGKKSLDILRKYWGGIRFISKSSKRISFDNSLDNLLTIRGEIFPVPNNLMIGLIHASVKDILLTGDQSISDALSCCSDKNIFYQIAEWKWDFADKMAKAMPNKYLSSKRTSCGTLNALNYKSDYAEFKRKNNFFWNAKSKLDGIFCAAIFREKFPNSSLCEFEDIVKHSRTLKQVKLKFKKLGK
jgi:hypothetical protein